MAGDFTLNGLQFRGINGGPEHARFSEAISFSIDCKDQSEVDYYWDSLVDGGEESMCGWLKDKFGLSWQIVPTRLYELVSDPDPARARAATEAMFQMRRIVIADMEAAANSVSAYAHSLVEARARDGEDVGRAFETPSHRVGRAARSRRPSLSRPGGSAVDLGLRGRPPLGQRPLQLLSQSRSPRSTVVVASFLEIVVHIPVKQGVFGL